MRDFADIFALKMGWQGGHRFVKGADLIWPTEPWSMPGERVRFPLGWSRHGRDGEFHVQFAGGWLGTCHAGYIVTCSWTVGSRESYNMLQLLYHSCMCTLLWTRGWFQACWFSPLFGDDFPDYVFGRSILFRWVETYWELPRPCNSGNIIITSYIGRDLY